MRSDATFSEVGHTRRKCRICYHRAFGFRAISVAFILLICPFYPSCSDPVFTADLHCHSIASDGLLSPADVVRRAAGNGIALLSLTDHDNLGGLSEARMEAEKAGMRFIDGVEISIEWGGVQVHILGYGFDVANATLNAGLASIHDGRLVRAQRMADALAEIGIDGCFEGALRHAGNPRLVSRAHFARHLVERGICEDVRSVFDAYLKPGKPGYVEHRWPSLQDAVDWVSGAGGIAAIAHPTRYKFPNAVLRKLITEFKQLGGQGLEVVSGTLPRSDLALCARLAKQFDLLASCGSDFHGPGESSVDLGRIEPLPDGLTPIWEAF